MVHDNFIHYFCQLLIISFFEGTVNYIVQDKKPQGEKIILYLFSMKTIFSFFQLKLANEKFNKMDPPVN